MRIGRIVRSRGECHFVLNLTQITTSETEKEKDCILNEMDEIRQLLRLNGRSRNQGIRFRLLESGKDFKCYESLSVIIFSSSNQLRVVDRFIGCPSPCRIEVPSSVEKIGLHEIVLFSDSHLRGIYGLKQSISSMN
jgi:hypothetical protein